MNKNDKIFIAGHKGMVGSSLVCLFQEQGYSNIITATRAELDLRNQENVHAFMQRHQPHVLIIAAAKVGGIGANIKHPAEFLYDNVIIQNNLIHAAHLNEVGKIVFLGSSCIYPKACAQPMKEEYLMSGKLEPTNEGYAIAKITGIKMVDAYHDQYGMERVSIIPPNLYGPNDSFDLTHCHVLSALVKRFSDAKEEEQEELVLWGSGIARREFMHVNDLAKATLDILERNLSTDLINIGWGKDISIKELADLVAKKTGYKGKISWDTSKPDGMLKKCMDVSKMKAHGLSPSITLEEGIEEMIALYKTEKK